MSKFTFQISIVIPCFNAQSTIIKCLNNLLLQRYPIHEIIVVNDASTDNSESLVQSVINKNKNLVNSVKIKLIKRQKRGGAAASRTDGVKMATGDIIAFIDSDCFAPHDWLEKIVYEFKVNSELVGLGGKYSHFLPNSIFSSFVYLEEEYFYFIYSQNPDKATLPGGNSAFRKNILEKYMLTSSEETILFKGIASGEDTTLCNKIKKIFYIKYINDLEVFHDFISPFGYLKRHLRRGISRATIIFKKLSDNSESLVTFSAYGGFKLLLSSVFLVIAILSLFIIVYSFYLSLFCFGIFLFIHYILSIEFFIFEKTINFYFYRNKKSFIFKSIFYRLILLIRLCCWFIGSIIGILRTINFMLRF